MNTTLKVRTQALALISRYEGSAGGAINTYDGQLLSYGSIHYALKSGGLYPMLRRCYTLDPIGMQKIMGVAFTAALTLSRAAFTTFVTNTITPNPRAWRARFAALWNLPARAQADAEAAAGYFLTAEKIARRYGLTSERGFTFAFDRAVQQGGSFRPTVDRAFQALKARNPDAAEYDVMKVLARAYADSANPRYADNVYRRAVAIALGGTDAAGVRPNGVQFHLARDYDLLHSRPWALA